MDPLTLVVVVVALVVVAAVVGGLSLLTGRRRRAPRPPETPPRRPDQARETPDRTGLEPAGRPEAGPQSQPDALPDLLEPRLDRPEPPAGRLARLRGRLARSQGLGRGLLAVLTRDRLDEQTWEDVEDILLGADVGVGPTQELVANLRTKVSGTTNRTTDDVRRVLRAELLALLGTDTDRSLATRTEGRPTVVLVVGVNGTGKTTTVGKLGRVLVADGQTVLFGAADTFRAAAAEQLTTWGERVGAPTVRGAEGADPASVAFDAVQQGIDGGYDVVLLDTAGRLQNKVGLMDELGKVKRVVEKHGPIDEVLLVLDATTGQNGLLQARVFREAVDVSGIVLTKLDGTAKGGIVVAVQRELGVPVKLVGLGEGADDLAPFQPEQFVDALLGG